MLLITVKTDIAAAINFALGASANELHVFDLKTLKYSVNEIAYVELTFMSQNPTGIVKRELVDRDEENFYFKGQLIEAAEYMMHLNNFGYDIKKQIHFYDAANRKLFWNLIPSEQDQLIAALLGATEDVRKLNEDKIYSKKCEVSRKLISKEMENNENVQRQLRERLPAGGRHAWVI